MDKVDEILEEDEFIIRSVKVSDTTKQLIITIPKEVEDYLKIEKGDQFEFKVKVPQNKNEKPNGIFTIIKSPKLKHGKKKLVFIQRKH